jgi:hypothetical protein
LFKTYNETLDASGIFASEGKIVDASFVQAPRQRNSRKKTSILKKQEQL